MTGPLPTARVVGVANGDYAALDVLARAVPDTSGLVELLVDKHGFDGVLLADRRRGQLLDEIEAALARKSIPGGALVVLWTGHGGLGADGSLRLLGRTTDTDEEVATAARLGELAARTGATQVLVVLDTCFSGQGVPDALVMANAVLAGRADPAAAWFGVVAAARGDEPSRSGAMARELARLLTEGPADPALRLRWSAYDARIRGDDLVDALLKEWSEPRHTPQQAATGNAWPMLRNPLHRPRASHAVVEHLLQAARGTSTGETFFTGREEVLEPIIAWLRGGRPGSWVVTGPAGSGKSAILGRVVSLSAPEERARLAAEEVPAHLDPGESSIDAHLHTRGLALKGAVEIIATQLGLAAGSGIYDVLAHAGRRREAGDPLVVVIDGLDEAGDVECRDLAVQLVDPLSREGLVLIGSREVPGGAGEPGLLALLGTAAGTTDLGATMDDSVRDVHLYATRRLRGIAPEMDAEVVADEIASMARAVDSALEGPFLLARLITSQLRQVPVDTSAEGWRTQLASSVEAALEHDLKRTVLTVGGREHPTAARELMLALACAYGAGMPADDVWPALASALSPSGTQYTRDDVYALLVTLGRHVVAGAVDDQAVYRVAHQRLVDHLRPMVDTGIARRIAPVVAQPVAEAVAALYGRLLDEGQPPEQHAYLWRYAWRHLADAGLRGVELLRPFVDRYRDAFLPDLVEVLDLVASRFWWLGSAEDAARLLEESVTLSREMNDPLDLAMRLFSLASARAGTGDTDSADDAASEASALARMSADDPASRTVLAATLTAHALTQLRQGNFEVALRLATESVEVLEDVAGDEAGRADMMAGGCTIAAMAALNHNDFAQADAFSARALSMFDDRVDDPTTDAGLFEALFVRAQVELIQSSAAAASGSDTAPARPATARIVELHRLAPATGTVSDIAMAQCLRVAALTMSTDVRRGVADPNAPGAAELLDHAINLVAPMASGSAEAGLAMAVSLASQAELTTDPEVARAHLAEAEVQLRRILTSSQDAATQLSMVLGRQVRMELAEFTEDLSAVVERLQEAVDLLADDQRRWAREHRDGLLNLLADLLSRSGQPDQAVFVLDDLLDERRRLLDGSPHAALRLAIALSEMAGTIFHLRPVEAADFAEEGLALLDSIDPDFPNLQTVQGFCELNLSAACMTLRRSADAARSVRRAIELLDTGTEAPLILNALGSAFTNQSLLQLREGENEAALLSARRAVSLLERPGVPSQVFLVRALARVNLGQALAATGEAAEAAEVLGASIAELKAQLNGNPQSMAFLAAGLDAAGSLEWDTALAELADQPSTMIELSLMRSRPPEELDLTIGDITTAITASADDPVLMRGAREMGRLRRAVDPERFDDAWRDAVGEVPDWLQVDPLLSYLLVAWWNTSSWAKSRDYLQANLALLAPATDILIEEMRAAGSSEELAAHHLRLRADAAEHGVEAAYAFVLAQDLIAEWARSEDEEAFLVEHYDELLGPDVANVLDQDEGAVDSALTLAVLTLARRAEQAVAFQVLGDVAEGIPLLQPAWRSADVERLKALAVLCRWQGEEAPRPDWRTATTALAIAEALQGNTEGSVELAGAVAAEIDDQEERTRLIGAVVDAITHHPERQGELIGLVGALSRTG